MESLADVNVNLAWKNQQPVGAPVSPQRNWRLADGTRRYIPPSFHIFSFTLPHETDRTKKKRGSRQPEKKSVSSFGGGRKKCVKSTVFPTRELDSVFDWIRMNKTSQVGVCGQHREIRAVVVTMILSNMATVLPVVYTPPFDDARQEAGYISPSILLASQWPLTQ